MLARLSVLACLILAAAGAAAMASGHSGAAAQRTAKRPPLRSADARRLDAPIPRRRPRVVEPVAGDASGVPVAVAAQTEEPAEIATAGTTPDDGNNLEAPRPRAAASTTRSSVRGGKAHTSGDPNRALALPNGLALPPLAAPAAVLDVIRAGNTIARSPYKWGGGHGRWVDDGYDCSGSVSYALFAGGLIDGPRTSGGLRTWGEPGRGKWITLYTHDGHVFMEVAGIRFDTSGARNTGSRWQNGLRSHAGYVVRHPPGL